MRLFTFYYETSLAPCVFSTLGGFDLEFSCHPALTIPRGRSNGVATEEFEPELPKPVSQVLVYKIAELSPKTATLFFTIHHRQLSA